MKKCIIILMALALCVGLAVPALAAEAPQPRLVDQAELLSQSEARQLTQLLDEISTRQGVDVVVVTADSVDFRDSKSAARSIYKSNGYKDDGVILFINMDERDMTILPLGQAVAMFSVAGQDYIADRVQPELSDGDYVGAIRTYGELCDDFITQAKSGDPYDDHNLPKDPYPVLLWLAISLVVGLVVALIVTGVMRGKLKSVRFQSYAADYVRPGSMNVRESRDLFLYRNVTRRPRPKPSSSGSSGGRSAADGTTRKF